MKCYLAHATIDKEYVKKYIEPKLKECFVVVNPFDRDCWEEENKRFEEESISDDLVQLSNIVVTRDLECIHDSDLVVVFVKSFSIGAFMEIALASHIFNKRVIAIVAKKKYVSHPWLLAFVDEIYCSVDDLIEAYRR